jgi:hypothetical protein
MTIAYTSGSAVKAMLGMGTAAGTADAVLGVIVGDVNAWLENRIGRQVGPLTAGTFILDGSGDDELYVPVGVRSLTSVSVYLVEGATTAVSIGTADILLQPAEAYRSPGWPAFTLELREVNASGVYAWPEVDQGVTLVGSFGWAAIPAELTGIATRSAIAMWRGRASSGGDTFTVGASGEKTYERFLSFEDRKTIERYATGSPGIG